MEDITEILLKELDAKSLEEALQKARNFFQLLSQCESAVLPHKKFDLSQRALAHIKILFCLPGITPERRDLINYGLQVVSHYGNKEAESLLAQHTKVCELLQGEFGTAYYDTFSSQAPDKVTQLCEKYPDQLYTVVTQDPYCLPKIAEIYFILGDVYQRQSNGQVNVPPRIMAIQCYFFAARLGNQEAKDHIQIYIKIGIIEEEDFDYKYHQAFINSHQDDLGFKDLEKDIRHVCQLNPNQFCQMIAADVLITPSERERWQEYLVEHHFDQLTHDNQRSLRSVVVEMDPAERTFSHPSDDIQMDELSVKKRHAKKEKSLDELLNDNEKLLQKSDELVKSNAPEQVKIRAGNVALGMTETLKKLARAQGQFTIRISQLITYGLEIAIAGGNEEAKALLEQHRAFLLQLPERLETLIAEFNVIVADGHKLSQNPHLTQENRQDLSKTLLKQATHLESLIFKMELDPEKDKMCGDMIMKLLEVAIACGTREEIREAFYLRGNECQDTATGNVQRIAATRHYLLAASLGHPLASTELIAICKLDPNAFRRSLAHNVALAKEECEKWQKYVDTHYPPKTLLPEKSVFQIKASFFESSSDEEKDATGNTLPLTNADILNSNNTAAPG